MGTRQSPEVQLAEGTLLESDRRNLPPLERRLVVVDDEARDEILAGAVLAERRDHERDVEDGPVRDPELGAVQDVVVAARHRGRLDAARVGADVRLAGGGARQALAYQQIGQESRPLLGGAAHVNALDRALVPEQRESEHGRKTLVEQPQHDVGEPAPALVLRDASARVAEAHHRPVQVEHYRSGQRAIGRVGGEQRLDLGGDDAPGRLREHPLRVRELEVHSDVPSVRETRGRRAQPRRAERRGLAAPP